MCGLLCRQFCTYFSYWNIKACKSVGTLVETQLLRFLILLVIFSCGIRIYHKFGKAKHCSLAHEWEGDVSWRILEGKWLEQEVKDCKINFAGSWKWVIVPEPTLSCCFCKFYFGTYIWRTTIYHILKILNVNATSPVIWKIFYICCK